MAFLKLVTFCCTFVLALFTARRVILTLAAIFVKSRAAKKSDFQPDVMALVPAGNEQAVIARCLDSLLKIEWPKEKLYIVAIDDGSTDDTAEIIEKYSALNSNMAVLKRNFPEAGRGKGAALNAAIERFDFGDLIYVVDADSVVSPDALGKLVDALDHENAQAAQGKMTPWRASGDAASFYTRLESSVHQDITMSGAERIGATVSLLGSNSIIKRNVLEMLGGFNPSSRLEDIDLTVAMENAGMKIVFAHEAESTIMPAAGFGETARQHRAWSREFFRIGASRLLETIFGKGSLLKRLDRLMFAFGYVDRLFILAYLALVLLSQAMRRDFASWGFLAAVLAAFGLQCILALHRTNAPFSDYMRLAAMPVALVFDLGTHCIAFWDALRGRGRDWKRTSREGVAS